MFKILSDSVTVNLANSKKFLIYALRTELKHLNQNPSEHNYVLSCSVEGTLARLTTTTTKCTLSLDNLDTIMICIMQSTAPLTRTLLKNINDYDKPSFKKGLTTVYLEDCAVIKAWHLMTKAGLHSNTIDQLIKSVKIHTNHLGDFIKNYYN